MFAYRTRISGGASKQPDAAIAHVAENLLSRNMMLAMQCSFLLMQMTVATRLRVTPVTRVISSGYLYPIDDRVLKNFVLSTSTS